MIELSGHINNIRGVTVLENKETLYSYAEGGELIEWDFSTGKIIRSLKGHTESINSLIQVNSEVILSGDSSGKLVFWDINKGKVRKVDYIRTGAISRLKKLTPSKILIQTLNNDFVVFNISEPIKSLSIKLVKKGMISFCLCPKKIFTAFGRFNGNIDIFRIEPFEKVKSYKLSKHPIVNIVNFNNGYLGCLDIAGKFYYVSLKNGAELKLSLLNGPENYFMIFCSLKNVLIIGQTYKVSFFDASTFKLLNEVIIPFKCVNGYCVTTDESMIAVCCSDKVIRLMYI